MQYMDDFPDQSINQSINPSILLALVLDQLENDLASLVFGMLHADLDSAAGTRHGSTIRRSSEATGEIDSAASTRWAIARARTGHAASII